jgi:DNA polymerase III subunit delta'
MSRDSEELFEADRLDGTPHPRLRSVLIGHSEAERAFLDAMRAGRLHHAWLIGGPEGIGKATLAYRVARRLLAQGPGAGKPIESLAVDPEASPARQVAALSHPNLAVLRRSPGTDKKAPSATISVDAVRNALHVFNTTAADGGYRVCIVDSADDLTIASANALLKMIEEPPPRSVFLIVSHAPQRLLPTIRSRCRRLLLRPLADEDIRAVIRTLGPPWSEAPDDLLAQAVALGEGSVRRTLEMLDEETIAFVSRLTAMLQSLPNLDLKAVLSLADSLARRDAENEYVLVLETVRRWISARLHAQAGEGAQRLAPLVEVCEKVAQSAREVDVYNLDRRPLVLALFDDLAGAIRRTA